MHPLRPHTMMLLSVVSLLGCGARTNLRAEASDAGTTTDALDRVDAKDADALPPTTPVCLPGDAPVAVAKGQSGSAITVAGDHVYWVDGEGGAYRVPKRGGSVVSIGVAREGWGIVADDRAVVFGERLPGGTVQSWDGTSTRTIATVAGGVYGLALEPDYAYFAFEGAVGRLSRASGELLRLATPRDASHVAVDATHVYWTEWSGAVRRTLKTGSGVVEDLAREQYSYGIAIDDRAVYVTSQGSPGQVYAVDKKSVAKKLLATAPTPDGIAVADGMVYFAEMGGDRITQVSRDGGATRVVATTVQPRAVAIDGECVYWLSSRVDGSIMRAPR